MARIPQTFIDDLLTRIDIIDVIDKRISLKKTGNNYTARCPFHNEKTPSFTANARKQFYYCFGCGASGNAISFLMQHDNLSFIEAIEQLAQQVGMTVPVETSENRDHNERQQLYNIMQRANEFYQQQLRQHPNADQSKTYLKERGLSGQMAKTFQIGFAPPGWNNLQQHLQDIPPDKLIACGLLIKNEKGKVYDRFRNRIMFPIRDRQGRVIGFGGRVLGDDTPKYLNSPETTIFQKGSELYGLYEALQSNRHLEQILVVEGYMDVIALAQHEILNAVATLGTATTKANAERLFRQANNITFCFDGDTAGRNAAWRALENILPLLEDGLNVHFIFLPEGEDPDSMVRKLGTAKFEQLLQSAIPLSIFLLNHLSENCDLNSLDGRSRLVKLAEPLLKLIPGKVFQQLLLIELAKRVKMDENQLRSLLSIPGTSTTRAASFTMAKPVDQQKPSLMQRAISLILQYPKAVKYIKKVDAYQVLELPGSPILLSCLDLLINDPNLSTGALLEHWRDQPNATQLAKLAMRKLEGLEKLSMEQVGIELEATLEKLLFTAKEQKLANLHQRYAAGELDQEGKLAYSTLLAEQRMHTKE